MLPTADRVMNMQLTVRDNRSGGGGVAGDGMLLTVSGAPFAVTSPNGGESLVSRAEEDAIRRRVVGGIAVRF